MIDEYLDEINDELEEEENEECMAPEEAATETSIKLKTYKLNQTYMVHQL